MEKSPPLSPYCRSKLTLPNMHVNSEIHAFDLSVFSGILIPIFPVYKPSSFNTTSYELADAVLNAIQQKFKFKSFTGGKYIMGRTRIVSLLGVAHESTFHLGHMAVMTYFATLLDQTLGKKMYAILGSDCHYKSVYGLPTNGCDDSEQAYYDATIYQEVIQFIDSVVIPAIVALGDEDLLDSYGGVEEFAEKLRSSENYLHSLVLIPEEENTDYSAHNIKVLCEEISDVLKESLSTSTPFNLSYD